MTHEIGVQRNFRLSLSLNQPKKLFKAVYHPELAYCQYRYILSCKMIIYVYMFQTPTQIPCP